MFVGSSRANDGTAVVAEHPVLVSQRVSEAVPGEGCYSAWVGSAGRWAYVFVGAPTGAAVIVPVEGVGSTNIRKIGVDNCDGGNRRTTSIRINLVTMLISC